MSSPRVLTAVVVALALLAAAACSSTGSPSAEAPGATSKTAPRQPTPVEVDDEAGLYAPPDPLPPGTHGDLLRHQRFDSPVGGATAHRVMYLSESIAGDPIAVTGVVLIPTAAAPPEGRTVLAVAHGTTGIADECAPSRQGGGEQALAAAAVERGWILAITDYEGLGTPGRHPYLVGESEGRSVIDSVRAAARLPDAARSDRVLIAGYSQGGHGALWAAQVAPEWAPELDVMATFAGAPVTELPLVFAAAGAPRVAGFGLLLVAGFAAAYPEADPATFLTDEGMAVIDAVDRGCLGEVFRATAGRSELVRPGAATSEPWATLASANDPGRVKLDGPVLIVHSDADDVVPAALSGLLHDRMCGLGQRVERRVLADGGGHGAAALPAFTQAVAWFDGLIAGEQPTSTCP